jgi:hypothetical protein
LPPNLGRVVRPDSAKEKLASLGQPALLLCSVSASFLLFPHTPHMIQDALYFICHMLECRSECRDAYTESDEEESPRHRFISIHCLIERDAENH